MSGLQQRTLRRKRGLRRIIGYAVVAMLVIFITLLTIIEAFIEFVRGTGSRRGSGTQETATERLHKIPAKQIVLSVAALVAVLGAIAGASVWYAAMSDTGGLYEVVSESLEYPAENSLAADEYTVAADMPRLISMPTIGAEGIIQQVADDQNKFIASPSNVRAAGWYNKSAKPGQPGLSIIDGHIEGKYSKGVFYDLSKLKEGDRFSVAYGDGGVKNFEVISVKTISIRDVKTAAFERLPAIKSQLNLVSATSAFNQGTEAYNRRVIVLSRAR